MFERRKIENAWEGKIEPFKMVGNVYFIGTFQASSHLIDTGDGLILIDTGYSNTLYLVIRSIYELGFNPKDIKYIINTHWHGDHTEATKAMVDLSGAKTLIGRYDKEKVLKYFTPDILIKDGDVLTLGNTTINFLETPGHTKGTISLFFETKEKREIYRVGMFGGAGANTLVKNRFDYDECREDYIQSIKRLKKEKVYVFIGNNVWNNDTAIKGNILLSTGENKFIDNDIWFDFLDFCEKRFGEIVSSETNQ